MLISNTIDVTGTWELTVREVIELPVIVHTFVAQLAAVPILKLLAVGEQAYTPAPYETELNNAQEVIAVGDVQPPHVPKVPDPDEK